jgi:hypothetical protein
VSAILSVVSHSIWPAKAILSVVFFLIPDEAPLLALDLFDDRLAEGGEVRDGEGCRHAEMGYGGLPAEAGDDERGEVVVCRPRSASPWDGP